MSRFRTKSPSSSLTASVTAPTPSQSPPLTPSTSSTISPGPSFVLQGVLNVYIFSEVGDCKTVGCVSNPLDTYNSSRLYSYAQAEVSCDGGYCDIDSCGDSPLDNGVFSTEGTGLAGTTCSFPVIRGSDLTDFNNNTEFAIFSTRVGGRLGPSWLTDYGPRVVKIGVWPNRRQTR